MLKNHCIGEEKNMNNTVFLKDEFGNNVAFEFSDLVKYKNNEYVILMRVDKPESSEVVVLKCEKEDNGDEETYTIVEDNIIYERVCSIFRRKFQKSDAC